MKQALEFPVRIFLVALVWLAWRWAFDVQLSTAVNLSIIVLGELLVLPLVWLGRKRLDQHRTASDAAWTTTFVQFGLGFLLGIPLMRAIRTHLLLPGWALPVPTEVGLTLVILTGATSLIVVANLALKGLGAPFFIALSKKLAADWLYAWTRNPMVLAGLALLLSLGVWFQSILFVLWTLILFAPALLFFIKLFEERELEARFGAPYLEYKSKTPMLFPRRPLR